MSKLPPFTLEEARERFPPIWTIYEKPKDFPDKWVVRLWWGEIQEPEPVGLCDSLELARLVIEAHGGSFQLRRAEHDAPCIVESWV